MSKYLKKIKSLKKISKSNVVSSKFLIAKKDNIKIYYAPFDYINPKAKIMIVGITPGLQQMLQSFQVINDGKSLKEVKDLSSFKGSMRTSLIKYLDELEVNQFYWEELIGLEVYLENDDKIGVVSDIIETGSNDVLVIQGNKEYLIPYLYGESIKKISLKDKKIIINNIYYE